MIFNGNLLNDTFVMIVNTNTSMYKTNDKHCIIYNINIDLNNDITIKFGIDESGYFKITDSFPIMCDVYISCNFGTNVHIYKAIMQGFDNGIVDADYPLNIELKFNDENVRISDNK